MSLSAGVLDQLAAQLSSAAEWMPFCRTLGILCNGPRGQALEVLQICLRTPLFPEPGWSTRLIVEADQMEFRKSCRADDDVFLKDWIELYRLYVDAAREKHSGPDNAALAAACGPDLAREFLKLGTWQAEFFLKDENNPCTRAEGFWIAVASILPGWRDRFPLIEAEVNSLLREFDTTYDESWKSFIRDLEPF